MARRAKFIGPIEQEWVALTVADLRDGDAIEENRTVYSVVTAESLEDCDIPEVIEERGQRVRLVAVGDAEGREIGCDYWCLWETVRVLRPVRPIRSVK